MDDPSAALAGRHRRQGVFLSLELGPADWFASGELILSGWSSERGPLSAYSRGIRVTPGALGWRGFRALAGLQHFAVWLSGFGPSSGFRLLPHHDSLAVST